MEKREWIYAMNPKHYEIACDKCNGTNIEWSEYKEHIWCYDCKIDTKGTGGIFDGPIPLGAAELFGITFNRIRISDGRLLEMKRGEKGITWEAE